MNTMKNKFYKTTSRKIEIKKATESKKEEVIDKACEDVSAFWLGKKFQQHGWNDAFEKYIAFPYVKLMTYVTRNLQKLRYWRYYSKNMMVSSFKMEE